jgi:hypothetical protein
MVTTRVTWVYPTVTNKQIYTTVAFMSGKVISDLLAKLNAKGC